MAVKAVRTLASRAPVPVFAAVGAGAAVAIQSLRLFPHIRLVRSPRHATVLLAAGLFPKQLYEALARVHDQLPHPRATVFWGARDATAARTLRASVTISPGGDAASEITRVYRAISTGELSTESDVLPDAPPAPWRGVGEHGQGGEGMMGGRPYGRPMAHTGEDRDGLELDRLPVDAGPFFPLFPPGFTLHAVLQGDVIQAAEVAENPFPSPTVRSRRGAISPAVEEVFVRALSEPVAIAELEVARARHHLRSVAAQLDAAGLYALALRALVMAEAVGPGGSQLVHRLQRRLERWLPLRWSTKGAGRLDRSTVPPGVVGRASGRDDDVRGNDRAYRALGFRPIVQEEGDAEARWRQRLAEAEQSLDLAQRAGETNARCEPTGVTEGPRGPLGREHRVQDDLIRALPDLIRGMEWGEAVATIVSLDLSLEEAALAPALTRS